jgi:hypothetical protein
VAEKNMISERQIPADHTLPFERGQRSARKVRFPRAF